MIVFSNVTDDRFMAGSDNDLDFLADGLRLEEELTGELSTDSGYDVGAWENSTLAAGDGSDRIRRLKASYGRTLVAFGGVRTVRMLVAADLVDEYWLKFNPTIVGRGGSMFSDVVERRALTLRSARTFPSGTIAAIYSTT